MLARLNPSIVIQQHLPELAISTIPSCDLNACLLLVVLLGAVVWDYSILSSKLAHTASLRLLGVPVHRP